MEITRRDSLAALLAATAIAARPAIGHAGVPDVVIGAPNSLTGGFGELGTRDAWGFVMAAEHINRTGGIKSLGGAKLRVLVADTSTDNPTQGASVARRMLDQDKATMLYGATASAITMAIQVISEQARVPLLTTSYVDAVVGRGLKYTFKTTALGSHLWNFAMDGLVQMMTAVEGKPPASCGIFMGSDAVSMAVSKSLPIEAKRIGLPVVAHVNFQGNLTDASVVISPILRYKPATIFLSAFLQDAVLILKALRGLGIKTPVAAAGGVSSDSAGKAMGAAADRVFMPWSWNWDLPVQGESEVLAMYKQLHPHEPYPPNDEQLGMGYAGGLICAQALEKAASRDGEKLRAVLASTTFTGLPIPARVVKFGANGLNQDAALVLAEWHGGSAHTVWPKELQAMKPVI